MNIHPATPPKLVKKYKKLGSMHKLAEELSDEDLEVNIKWVQNLITKGKEPNDTTPTLREIRHRLGLRKHKPRDRPKPAPAPKHMIWWNNQGKVKRHRHVLKIYRNRSKP